MNSKHEPPKPGEKSLGEMLDLYDIDADMFLLFLTDGIEAVSADPKTDEAKIRNGIKSLAWLSEIALSDEVPENTKPANPKNDKASLGQKIDAAGIKRTWFLRALNRFFNLMGDADSDEIFACLEDCAKLLRIGLDAI